MAFWEGRVSYFHMPSTVDDIEQLNCVKLLGVLFQDNLKMDSHVHSKAAATDKIRVVV